jgi:hypothetical protein
MLRQHFPSRSTIVEGLQELYQRFLAKLIDLYGAGSRSRKTDSCYHLLQWSLDSDDLRLSNGSTIARIFEPTVIEHQSMIVKYCYQAALATYPSGTFILILDRYYQGVILAKLKVEIGESPQHVDHMFHT